MPKMQPCPTCRQQIAASAATCPLCGERLVLSMADRIQRNMRWGLYIMVGTALTVFVVALALNA